MGSSLNLFKTLLNDFEYFSDKRHMNLKESFSEEEKSFAHWVIFETGEWSEKQVDKAATGIACGACVEDPWPVRLKTWVELERARGLTAEEFAVYLDSLWLTVCNNNTQSFASMVLLDISCSKEDVSFYESV